jgi:hypothetical protein
MAILLPEWGAAGGGPRPALIKRYHGCGGVAVGAYRRVMSRKALRDGADEAVG